MSGRFFIVRGRVSTPGITLDGRYRGVGPAAAEQLEFPGLADTSGDDSAVQLRDLR
jgi:hypothetical protein